MTDGASSAAAIQRAQALLDLGRHDEAATATRDVLAREPTHTQALVLLSQALRRTKVVESYEVACEAARVEPNSAWVHINLAWAAEAAGNRQIAITSARAAVALDPHGAAGYHALAQLLAKSNKSVASARDAVSKAMELAPHDPSTWIAAGRVALAEKNLPLARGYYERALALQPSNRTAQLNLAAVRQADGAIGHSMDLLQSIIRLNPRDETARLRLDELAQRLLNEMLWLSLAAGFVLAVVVGLIVGAD